MKKQTIYFKIIFMEIKIATDKDYKELLSLCDQFKTSPFYFDKDLLNLSDNKIHPYFAEKMLLSPYSTSIILKNENLICGFITVGVNTAISNLTGVKIGNIILLVVKPEYRGRGYGKLLIQSGIKFLNNYGIKLITVGTDIYNIPAIKDYEDSGFRFQMGWHIMRYFARDNILANKINENIEPLETPKILSNFYKNFKRPLSLLKERCINPEIVKSYLFEQLIRNLYQNKIFSLCYKKKEEIIGIINFHYDEITENTISTGKRVIKILDLLISDKLDEKERLAIKSSLIKELKKRFFNTFLIEMWVDAEDQENIKILERNNFFLSYSGVYLHRKV